MTGPATGRRRWTAGFARRDITAWEPGMAMLGWGELGHRVRGVRQRLHVRVVVLRDGPRAVAWVSLELCFVTQLLRRAILEGLGDRCPGLGPHTVLLSATHTHSGPSGITDSVLYGAQNFGWSPRVFDPIVAETVAALEDAWRHTTPAVVRLGTGALPDRAQVVHRRSQRAFAANPEALVTPDPPRAATVLRVDAVDGAPLGLVATFACHGTALHPDLDALDGDHPGRVSLALEARLGAPGRPFVALVSQGATGDLTPNFVARGGVHRGPQPDLAWAATVADAWTEAVRRGHDAARGGEPLGGELQGSVRHVDMRRAETGTGWTTSPLLGVSFVVGTREGPGPFGPVRALVRAGQGARRRLLPGREAKIPFGPLSRGIEERFFGLVRASSVARVASGDPVLAWLAACQRAGLPVDRPWVPCVLPAQVLRIGALVVGAVASEPTSTAGARLAEGLRRQVPGATAALVVGHANAYAGYVATPEEYGRQRYEGGHTLFGRDTLGAWQVALGDAARDLGRVGEAVPGPSPEIVDRTTLDREREVGRRFAESVGAATPRR